jgi:hypothetical protein
MKDGRPLFYNASKSQRQGKGEAMATSNGTALAQVFEDGCLSDVETCKALGYNPKAFVAMVHRYGAVEAARRLLSDSHWPDGFTRLCLMNPPRYDLTLEAYIHNHPEFHGFFTPQQLAECDDRLTQVGYI